MILLKMKETAEAYLGAKINDAVACTLVPCEACATAHVVRACFSNNFSAILLNLSQMGKSVAILGQRQGRNHTSSDGSMLSQHIQL